MAAALALALVSSACARSGSPEDESGLDRSLAGTPQIVELDPSTGDPDSGTVGSTPPGGVPATASDPTATSSPADQPTSDSDDRPGDSPASGSVPTRTLVAVDDPLGDGDLLFRPPAWADLRRVSLVAVGDDRVRVVVEVHGTLPRRTDDGVTAGIGVDIYRSDPDESDHQVFFDGGTEGWFAYLTGPEGLVPFPGTFTLGTSTLTVDLPADALGGVGPGSLDAFYDWADAAATVPRQTTDVAPDRGRASFG